MSTRIQNSGALSGSKAQIDVWGLTLDLMNQLSTLGMVVSLIPRNTLTLTAGDAASGMSTVFVGTILQAYGDFNAAPDVPFHFECNAGTADAVAPALPSSYAGPTDVGAIMSSIAKQANYGFANYGVNVKVSSPYLAGSLKNQWDKLAAQVGIEAQLINGVLTIWPRGGAVKGIVPVVAPGQGMIGYPAYTQQGIIVKTVYNPQIGFGGQIQVQGSQLKAVNSTWNVYKLDHALDSLVQGGQWMSTVFGYNPKYPQPIPPQA